MAERRGPHNFWLSPAWLLGWKSLTIMPSCRMFSTNFSRCSSRESNFSAIAITAAFPHPTSGRLRMRRRKEAGRRGPAAGHAPRFRPRPSLSQAAPTPPARTDPAPGAGRAGEEQEEQREFGICAYCGKSTEQCESFGLPALSSGTITSRLMAYFNSAPRVMEGCSQLSGCPK